MNLLDKLYTEAQGFKHGDILVAINGNRQVCVKNRKGLLLAVPIRKNDGMSIEPLQKWLDYLIWGAKKIGEYK